MKHFADIILHISIFTFLFTAITPAWALVEIPATTKCEGVNLTSEKFLNALDVIVKHGDLTDVAFIEKALETKLDVEYMNAVDNHQHRYKRANYKSKSSFGAPISISLYFDVEREPQMDFPKQSIMKINDDGYLSECSAVSTEQFKQKFGGNFGTSGALGIGNGNVRDGGKTFEGVDGSKITLIYQGSTKSQYIYSPVIKQSWK